MKSYLYKGREATIVKSLGDGRKVDFLEKGNVLISYRGKIGQTKYKSVPETSLSVSPPNLNKQMNYKPEIKYKSLDGYQKHIYVKESDIQFIFSLNNFKTSAYKFRLQPKEKVTGILIEENIIGGYIYKIKTKDDEGNEKIRECKINDFINTGNDLFLKILKENDFPCLE